MGYGQTPTLVEVSERDELLAVATQLMAGIYSNPTFRCPDGVTRDNHDEELAKAAIKQARALIAGVAG